MNWRLAALFCGASVFVAAAPALAQPAAAAPDKTGTNPLELRYTIQPQDEYYLVDDEFNHNVLKLKVAVPFGGSRANINFTVPITTTNGFASLPGGSDGPITSPPPLLGAAPGGTDTGLGDIAVKTSYIPYFNAKRKVGLLVAVELGFTTATQTAMGTGRNTFMPSLTAAFFPARTPSSPRSTSRPTATPAIEPEAISTRARSICIWCACSTAARLTSTSTRS